MNPQDNEVRSAEETQAIRQKKVDGSRRSFAKAGMVAPVIMTLTSKTALGSSYQCTVSGMHSGNQSSHPGQVDCHVGISPGGWRQNATKTGSQDGSLNAWCSCGVVPFSITKTGSGGSAIKKVLYDGTWYKTTDASLPGASSWSTIWSTIRNAFGSSNVNATSFSSVFGGGDSRSLWDVLNQSSGSLEFHAVADYLNAELNLVTGVFNPVYADITPAYIVDIYNSSTLTDAEKQAYFELIHHN